MNIIDAIADERIFAPFFRGPSWDAWRAYLAALFGLPMTPEQLATYCARTGRTSAPTSPASESWLVIGRRGGKSFILAVIAVFLAAFRDWRPHLGPGEQATIMIVAQDRRQARTIKRFIVGLLRGIDMLKPLIENETQESIQLRNRITIEIHTASFRSTRGYTVVCCLFDELAYWPTDETAAEQDTEVLNAVRPSMATIPGAMLLAASSPYAKKGALFDAYRKHYAKDGDPVLVWQAPTRAMNSTVPQAFIDAHVAEDPSRAAAEYGAEFRSDLEAFVAREAVEACISRGVYERPRQSGIAYCGFCDPAGGSGTDSMTLAIAHYDFPRQVVIIDALREARPPFSPEIITSDFCRLLKTYDITSIISDRYAGSWVTEQFSRFGVVCVQSAEPKAELYVNLLPLVNSRRIELLDHRKMIGQLCGLERYTARSGRDLIDHAPSGHDDLINAVAGAAACSGVHGAYDTSYRWLDDVPDDDAVAARLDRISRAINRPGWPGFDDGWVETGRVSRGCFPPVQNGLPRRVR